METWKQVRSRGSNRQARPREQGAATKKVNDVGDMILEESILEIQQARMNAEERPAKMIFQ